MTQREAILRKQKTTMIFQDTLDIAASGMRVQRSRMNIAATNLANKDTTRTEDGGPYRRRDVVLESKQVGGNSTFQDFLNDATMQREATNLGVSVKEIAESNDAPKLVYDPGHPDANAEGYVETPQVSGIREMVNLMGAARAYEANTTVISTVKQMAEQALRIGR